MKSIGVDQEWNQSRVQSVKHGIGIEPVEHGVEHEADRTRSKAQSRSDAE